MTVDILEAIDNAVDDWEVSGDAMRWTPEAPKRVVFTTPIVAYQDLTPEQIEQIRDSWVALGERLRAQMVPVVRAFEETARRLGEQLRQSGVLDIVPPAGSARTIGPCTGFSTTRRTTGCVSAGREAGRRRGCGRSRRARTSRTAERSIGDTETEGVGMSKVYVALHDEDWGNWRVIGVYSDLDHAKATVANEHDRPGRRFDWRVEGDGSWSLYALGEGRLWNSSSRDLFLDVNIEAYDLHQPEPRCACPDIDVSDLRAGELPGTRFAKGSPVGCPEHEPGYRASLAGTYGRCSRDVA